MVEFVDLCLEVPEDEDDILSPKHDVIASKVVHEQEEVAEVKWQIIGADFLGAHTLYAHH